MHWKADKLGPFAPGLRLGRRRLLSRCRFGDIHAYTPVEAAFLVVVIFINTFISAYIIGTVTLLVTRADDETGQ